MADTGKRVEVRYGAFSCTIAGYDDPVAQMRDVLVLMQRMITETPALGETDAGLDDDQFARLDDALADWRASADDRGVIVIRSGQRIAGDTEDAEILADADHPAAGEAAPNPSAAIFSAPAAAVAEAAFAASMATDEADASSGDDSPSEAEAPLGGRAPEEPSGQAALFAAPAAEIAEEASSGGGIAAEPADPDDDAEDAEPVWGDEAAAERVQPAGAGEAEPIRGAELGPSPADAPPEVDGSEDQGGEEELSPDGTSAAPWSHVPPARAEREAEPSRRINIFAPPPVDAPLPEEQNAGGATPPAEPLASLRHAPTGPVADLTPAEPWDEGEGGDPDEVLDDGAGDWTAAEPRSRSSAETDGSEAGSAESTENRLAALITRYQSGMHERETAAAQHAAEDGVTAAELADRAGAAEVADLLAVSAAWLTLAGGHSRFTRRQVMEIFETLPGEHQRTLEARIKGFGRLVRSGTLMAVEDGAFAMPAPERERFRELMDQR